MLNNLFIDTDIILDIVLDRDEFFEDSSAIFKLYENSEIFLYTSTSVIINAQYTGQRLIQKEKCRAAIKYLLNYFIVIEANIDILKKAYQSKFTDIEDAIQYYTASKESKIGFFITRNIKDFKWGESNLSVMSPSLFLKQIK